MCVGKMRVVVSGRKRRRVEKAHQRAFGGLFSKHELFLLAFANVQINANQAEPGQFQCQWQKCKSKSKIDSAAKLARHVEQVRKRERKKTNENLGKEK